MVNVQLYSSSREAKVRKQCYPFLSMKSISFLGALFIAISVTVFQILGLGHPDASHQQRLRRSLIDESRPGEIATSAALPFEVADDDSELTLDYNSTSKNVKEISNDGSDLNDNNNFHFLADNTDSSFIDTNPVEKEFVDPPGKDNGKKSDRLEHDNPNQAEEDDSADAGDSVHSNDDAGFDDYPQSEDEEIYLSKERGEVSNIDEYNTPFKDALKERSIQAKEMAMRDLKTAYVPSVKYEHFTLAQPNLESSTSFSCQ